MPIYAYRCSQCGFEKDVMHKVSDPVRTTCPSCQTENFAKQLTAPGFQLKGSGWYATDFKGAANRPKPRANPRVSQRPRVLRPPARVAPAVAPVINL
ncbi:MAG: zinc ribbon domain-containing protein [Rhodocyclaceae bacterium]|nr:zinc ribbon domain-containing protein [Rhodocyclaceae bacterium]